MSAEISACSSKRKKRRLPCAKLCAEACAHSQRPSAWRLGYSVGMLDYAIRSYGDWVSVSMIGWAQRLDFLRALSARVVEVASCFKALWSIIPLPPGSVNF